MEFRLTEEQVQIEEMVRNLSRREFAPKAAAVDEERATPGEPAAACRSGVLLGICTPPIRRLGSRAVSYNIALREVAAGCAPLRGDGGDQHGRETIFRTGTRRPRRKYCRFSPPERVRGVCPDRTGGRLGCRRPVNLRPGGRDVFVLNGREGLSSPRSLRLHRPRDGPHAEIPRDQRLPSSSGNPRIRRGKARAQDGAEGSDHGFPHLRRLPGAETSMLGAPGEGLRIALGRWTADASASPPRPRMRRRLSVATEYAKGAEAVGRRLGDFQADSSGCSPTPHTNWRRAQFAGLSRRVS